MQRYFQTSVHALIISAFFALCLTGRLDFPALIVFAIALGVSCYRAIKGMDGLEKFLSHLFRRVVMTISGVGLAVVSSIIYLRINSVVLLILGLFISFWLVTLVFLLPNPQRYPFRVRRARKAGRML